MKTELRLMVLLSFVLFSSFSQAGLIVNGGFEDTQVNDGSWRWFTSDNVAGWDGSNIEIWDSLTKFESYEGEQHAELNAHGSKGSFSIFQTLSTSQNSAYDVSFAYAARRSTSEAFQFDIIDSSGFVIFSDIMDDHTVKSWSLFDTSFTALSDLTTIRFTTINSGTYGNFLDDVNVVTSTTKLPGAPVAVAEPTGILLSALLISVFMAYRTRNS
jgi:hypothetical protein